MASETSGDQQVFGRVWTTTHFRDATRFLRGFAASLTGGRGGAGEGGGGGADLAVKKLRGCETSASA